MTASNDHRYMQLALDACRAGIDAGQSPFGACIVHRGQVLATAHNHVWAETDPSAHAEVVCLRAACRATGTVHLPGATIYSTTEPCPMCFAALHWARVGRIVSAASIADARSFGFNELTIDNATLKSLGGLSVELSPGVSRDAALALYDHWRRAGGRAY